MRYKLQWNESTITQNSLNEPNPKSAKFEVKASCEETNELAINLTIQACIEKAVSYFPEHVTDESRYLICEWDTENTTLTLVVTDDSKKYESNFKVKCFMDGLNCLIKNTPEPELKNEVILSQSEMIKYAIKDYLTTCASFMKFSLVAVFHNNTRDKVELL